MKYGIICAMPEEIDLILKDIEEYKIYNSGMRDFYEGKLYGKDVVVAMSRIGKVAASCTVTIMLEHYKLDKIIFCGTAGGIDKDLNVGDVVVADRAVQHDFSIPWLEPYCIPIIRQSYFDSNEALVKTLNNSATFYFAKQYAQDVPSIYLKEFNIKKPKVMIGTIASGDQFICDKEKNLSLAQGIENLKCVEMEGAAVAQVCYEYDVSFAIVRVISDGANDNGKVDFDSFVEKAASYFTKGIIKAFLETV